MKKNDKKHRSYFFTWNNPTISLPELEEQIKQEVPAQYAGQKEKAASGTEHFQYCIQFVNPRSFNSVKKIWSEAHIEPCASFEKSVVYCTKTDTRVEGPIEQLKPRVSKLTTKQRNQTCIHLGPEHLVRSGELPISSYERVVKSTQLFRLRTARLVNLKQLDNSWFVGPSGAGKSKRARELAPNAFIKLPNKWWDGYMEQDTVIIDDLAKEHACLRTHLLQWSDHYPTPVEVKGATIRIRPSRIIVTSNYHPHEIWPEPKDHTAVQRRFKIIEVKKLNMPKKVIEYTA